MAGKILSENDFINQLIETWGFNPYEFITEYKGANQPLTFKCKKCGYEKELKRARNILYSRGCNKFEKYPCPNCNPHNNKNILNNNFEKFMKRIEELSGKKDLYTLIGEYNGNKSNVNLKCNICGYDKINTTTSNILSTLIRSNGKIHYCPNCNKLIHNKKPYEEKLKEVNSNISNIDDYINRKTKIKHKCNICGYIWDSLPNNRLQGEGCPKCSKINTISSYEDNLYEYIKSFYNKEIIRNNRNILSNKQELDFYFPEDNLAIEIDGNYWHNYEKKGIQYHLNKTKECEALGIQLVHIFTDELVNKKDLIYNKIKYLLKCSYNNKKIYARNCTVKELNKNEIKMKNELLDTYHIQGKDKASVSLGLFYNNELISVMTFCKPRKCLGQNAATSPYDYELSRFASNTNYLIIGAFSKLFKYFERNYEWSKILTYADRRWSAGNLYLKNGFKFLHFSQPNYWYFNVNNENIRIHRFSFRKNKLNSLFPDIYKDELSEYQIMKLAGYLKIYDCGSYVFCYEK